MELETKINSAAKLFDEADKLFSKKEFIEASDKYFHAFQITLDGLKKYQGKEKEICDYLELFARDNIACCDIRLSFCERAIGQAMINLQKFPDSY